MNFCFFFFFFFFFKQKTAYEIVSGDWSSDVCSSDLDDSGIEAAALGGAPGVWSARYAGDGATDEENLRKLLEEVPADGDRAVAYVCALAYVEPGRREEVVHGRCEGTLATEPRGTGGFGYDPAFIPDDFPGDSRTMAELTPR